ncbi:PAS domain-containing sensor histidine kinase [Haloarculaceae archaeon H-GB2-1]|nr:PAS domain-containing sensor histidine kinase [Haloarculaceae archaeon H-GB1-1]MEA5406420.1 PAS domain-containing sensor histidine kinase [Haloarculaceae archaeon H-GB2-1]
MTNLSPSKTRLLFLGDSTDPAAAALRTLETAVEELDVTVVTDGVGVGERLASPHLDCFICTRSGLEAATGFDAAVVGEVDVPMAVVEDGQAEVATALANAVLDHGRHDRVYETMVETSPMPALIHSADGTILFANEGLADLVGAESDADVVGTASTSYVHPADREKARDRMGRLFDDRELLNERVEYRLEVADGTRHVWISSVPITYDGEDAGLVIVNDMTEREERERALEQERDRFTALFDSVPNPVVHIEHGGADGEAIVQNANDAFEEVFGFSAGALAGDSLNAYVVPDRARHEARAIDERAAALDSIEREVRRVTDDGERTFLLQSIPFREDDSGAVETLAIYTDITDQKRREERLRRQNERLEEFASIVSHDLRNPLNVANGYLELLRNDYEDERFDNLEEALDRMDDLIEKVLAMARQGQIVDETEAVAVDSVAGRAWDTVATGDAELLVDAEWVIEADAERLVQLFENLFRNAIEHGRPSGDEPVTVSVGRLASSETDSAPENRGFFVEDDGDGIPAGDREQVFTSGYSTRDGGTGLGLNIVEQIAEAHGWEVRVTESDDGGARFEFTGVTEP